MNALILNQHSSNFGDDVTGCTLVKMLLENNKIDKVDILYNAFKTIPIDDDRIYHHLEQNFSNVGYFNLLKYYFFQRFFGILPNNAIFREWILLLRNADVVFVTPCGANIGIYKDWRFLLRILMAIVEKKTPIFHYNTIGKSGNIIFDSIAKYVLKNSKIYVREKTSEHYVKSLGLECKFGPDTAFALEPCNLKVNNRLVSFIPSQLAGWHPLFKDAISDEYILGKILPAIVDWANINNFKVEILPHLGTKSEAEFDQMVLSLMKKMGCKSVLFRGDILDYTKYDEAISMSRFVVGMRYHSIVLSAKNMRPFIALCYENKMKAVCAYTNCNKQAIDITNYENLQYADLLETLNCSIINETDIIESIKSTLPNLKKLTRLPITENVC